jgi:hypothetical protein
MRCLRPSPCTGGFLYHFLVAEDKVMVSTALPVLLKFTTVQGYNPVALGMIWALQLVGSCLYTSLQW